MKQKLLMMFTLFYKKRLRLCRHAQNFFATTASCGHAHTPGLMLLNIRNQKLEKQHVPKINATQNIETHEHLWRAVRIPTNFPILVQCAVACWMNGSLWHVGLPALVADFSRW